MAQYRTGTVTTDGSAGVVGTGTLWLAEVEPGDLFIIPDDGVIYEVAAVTDDTHLSLSAAFAGDDYVAAEYAIARDFTPVQGYPYPVKNDVETSAIMRRALEMIETKTTLISTSTTSLAIGTGSKTLTVETGKMFQPGQFISIVDQANNANYMSGQATAYTSATGSLTVDVVASGGSGTISAWNISLSGTAGATGSTGYVYVAYASDGAGAGFTNTFDPALDYIAVKSTLIELDPPVASDFAGLWKNYKGATGATGATGPQGDKGGLRYAFSSTTTAADPGAGVFRFNSATIASVTEIYIDALAEAAADVSAFISSWTVGSVLQVNSNANADTSLGIFTLTSITNNTGWFTLGVTFLSGAGFADTEECALFYSPRGAAGAGTGDVVGPASSTDSFLALFDGVTGKLLKQSAVKTFGGESLLGAGDIAVSSANADGLTHLYHPTLDGGFRDLYRAGWLPGCFNQQWGGAQWGNLPDGSFGSVATGTVQDDATHPIGDQVLYTSIACGSIVSETMTPPGVWLKLYKVGNPTDNITLQFGASSGGLPILGLGVLTSISGKQITSSLDGAWYFFSGSAPALTAATQYHLLIARSGSVDASNYYRIKMTTNRKYPFGLGVQFFNGSIWQASPTDYCFCFHIQNPAANSLIQPGGYLGNYKLAFNNGSPVNQSRSVAQPLSQFYDGKECSVIHRGTYAVSSNVWDFTYGLDHDRITVTINASGYPVLSIYEADRTLAQVTGTGAVTTGNHDVAIKVRTVGDGADYAYLYVDGVSVGTPLTAQTFTMSKEMRELGTARLGDGFGIIPAWTQDMQMTSLPSAQGWTWTGTGTEANCMSIQGGKLYQNANGYAATDSGYYQKTTTLVNSTGWTVAAKLRVVRNGNSATAGDLSIQIFDGTKYCVVSLTEFFIITQSEPIQMDFKSSEHVITIHGKLSDYYVLIDGKLYLDGTGRLTNTSALNQVLFGDTASTADQNSDVIWSYVKYYEGGMILPIANTKDCSEFAHWSGDKSALFAPLWNAGSPVSVKQLCGVGHNYVGEGVVQEEVRRGVTSAPTSTAVGTTSLIPEMEAYVIGSEISAVHQTTLLSSQAAGNVVGLSSWLDGGSSDFAIDYTALSSSGGPLSLPQEKVASLGLHKIESKMNQGAAGTLTSYGVRRILKVEAKS